MTGLCAALFSGRGCVDSIFYQQLQLLLLRDNEGHQRKLMSEVNVGPFSSHSLRLVLSLSLIPRE